MTQIPRSKCFRTKSKVRACLLDVLASFADFHKAQLAEREDLVAKNNELSNRLLEKAKGFTRQKKMYDSLKQQVMASQVAVAAGDEAELTLQTARGNRHIDRMPGVRSGTGAYSYPGASIHQFGGGGQHKRQGSGSSASSHQQRGGIGIGVGPVPTYASHLQDRGFGVRHYSGRKSMLGQAQKLYLTTRQSQRLLARHDKAVFLVLLVRVKTLYPT